ncbi:unnamed protein product [Caenorhabditis brenneri]
MSDYVKPLSYLSLKVVLELLDPSVRYHLTQRVPSIRTTASLVPLKIRHLSFGKLSMTLNDTEYKIGVYRHYPAGQDVPQKHLDENSDGGAKYNLNEFGLRDISAYDTAPEDISSHTPFAMTAHEYVQLIGDHGGTGLNVQFALNEYEIIQKQIERASESYEIYQEMNPNWISTVAAREMTNIIEGLKREAGKYKAEIFEMGYGPDVTAVPFTPYLQLTITKFGVVQKIERVEYNQKLYEGFKYMTTKIFNCFMKNREAISVKTLEIAKTHYVIPLPVGLKFKVDEVQSEKDLEKTINGIKQILDDKSRVLKN